jgi:3-deoxy-D-arabino-heptulosonate 7-phosphate (DAHP) synthase class II
MLSLQQIRLVKIERLRHQLSLVQKNEAFLLHAGDCAESFEACTQVRLPELT